MDFIRRSQELLLLNKWDGWLLYDFRRNNEIACELLQIDPEQLLTRRFLYWIPACGTPVKVCHAIEKMPLAHLEGESYFYSTWQQFNDYAKLLVVRSGAKNIAMEYSPFNELPSLSKVDAGTFELIAAAGAAIHSSAAILQELSQLSSSQMESHHKSAALLDLAIDYAWDYVRAHVEKKLHLTEWDLKEKISSFLKERGAVEYEVLCAVNSHSADPHYVPKEKGSSAIVYNDWLLIDISCRLEGKDTIWADITRVAIVGATPTEKQKALFAIVNSARHSALNLIVKRFCDKEPVCGYEADRVCRAVIEQAGYGENFIHRTGHNLGKKIHGNGTHLDDFETHDTRKLLPSTCFTIEPGIYLPNELGLRLEWSLSIGPTGSVSISDRGQENIGCLF